MPPAHRLSRSARAGAILARHWLVAVEGRQDGRDADLLSSTAGEGYGSLSRRAFNATITVLADMSTAPTAGLSTIPAW